MGSNVTVDLAENCWIVTEGAAGMENQCLGLAERLGLPIRTFRVAVRAPWRWMAPLSLGSPFAHLAPGGEHPAPPWPRLLIGCGRQSIPFSRGVKRASPRTVTVQTQHPRVDPKTFDLVIPPEHDGLTGPNVFPILGSPNRITPERLAKARGEFALRFEGVRSPRLAVLIGGANSAYRFGETEARALGEHLRTLARDHGLMVTASRRTGAREIAILHDALRDTDAHVWDGAGIIGLLAWADAILVTADSVNMACEAGGTGKPVHIYPLPGGGGKFQHFHQALERRGVSRAYNGKIEQWSYAPLDETGRAAKRIRALLDERTRRPDMNV